MFWSAVSATILLLSPQTSPLTPNERSVWSRLAPSVVVLSNDGVPTGTAVLIDQSGLFVAHRTSVQAPSMSAKTSDGRNLTLQMISEDRTTQLALLKSSGRIIPIGLRPLDSPEALEPRNKPLFALLPSGPVRAAYVTEGYKGVMEPSRRVIPLSEIRLEVSPELLGGAILVSYDGELMGVLTATLPKRETQQQAFASQFAPKTLNLNNLARGGAQLSRDVGPGEMQVAYAISPEVTRRVLLGFRSPSHQVEYPTLGVMLLDAVGGGAVVQRVIEDSPAAKAGIEADDVILEVAGNPIRDQVDYGLYLYRQRIGAVIQLAIRRGNARMTRSVVVGKQAG